MPAPGSAVVEAAPAAPPPTAIDPGALPVGAKPTLPYLDTAAEKVYLPGGRTISTKRFRTDGAPQTGELLHARGGWLLPQAEYDGRGRYVGTTVRFLSTSSHARVVLAKARLTIDAVASNGRWFVAHAPDARTLRAVRVRDGHILGSHRFAGINGATTLSAGGGTALVRTVTHAHGRYVATTTAWRPTTGQARVLDRRRNLNAVPSGVGSSASHRYTAPGAGRFSSVLVDSRTQRTLWRVRDTFIQSFSPDDKRVVTADAAYVDDDTPWEMATTIRVRDARTGRLQATFTGQLGAGNRRWAPVWETPTVLLLHAAGEPTYDQQTESAVYPDQSLVRCSVVSGACRRVDVDVRDIQLQVRKSS